MTEFGIREVTELVTAVAAVGGVVMGFLNSFKIHDVHLSINSRMDQLLLEARDAAHAAGIREEKESYRTDSARPTPNVEK